MNFIKKIFQGEVDNSVHDQFQKFGKGEFKDRAVVKAKQSAGVFKINTSYEFANELVMKLAKKLEQNKTRVEGAIISTADLTGKLDFKDKKQFQGVKKYLIDTEISGEEILELLRQFPKAFFALSFHYGENSLKIKPKAPKSGKPGKSGDEAPKPDFCKLVTKDREWGTSFVFEKPDFKEAEIKHIFLINELVLPKGEKDFAKIRELAKRKGKVIRIANVDGKEIRTEKEFEA